MWFIWGETRLVLRRATPFMSVPRTAAILHAHRSGERALFVNHAFKPQAERPADR